MRQKAQELIWTRRRATAGRSPSDAVTYIEIGETATAAVIRIANFFKKRANQAVLAARADAGGGGVEMVLG